MHIIFSHALRIKYKNIVGMFSIISFPFLLKKKYARYLNSPCGTFSLQAKLHFTNSFSLFYFNSSFFKITF